MASSAVKICNEALALLGQEAITALSENSDNARFCNLLYEPTRDEVLRVFPWNFATTRASLARLSATPVDGSFNYYYQLPSDCLRVLGTDDTEDVWAVEGDRLLYDYDTAYITYIKRETDPNKFDSIFITALALRIASKLAMRITRSRAESESLLKQYVIVVGTAQSVSSQEGIAGSLEAETWLEAHER